MKTCILATLSAGEIGEIVDVRIVDDDHPFGPDPLWPRIHIEHHGELTVSQGKQYMYGPEQPLTINGVPASELKVYADGVLSRPVPIRRRDPAEAAERMRAGYRDAGIPEDLAEAMIEETLRGE